VKQRAIVAAIICGVAAIIAVPVLIFAYGRQDPSPPSLLDHPRPEIPGVVLFFDNDGCVVEAEASGAHNELLTCDLPTSPASFVSRLDANRIVIGQSISGPGGTAVAATILDLRTQQTTTTTLTIDPEFGPFKGFNQASQESVNGERVSIDEGGRVTVLKGTTKTEIRDFDVRDYQQPLFLTWSPDGEWMLLQYYDDGEQELWVLSRDGRTAGTLASGLRQPWATWYIEGIGASPKIELQ
jgi:hypothetical protein